MRQEIWEDYLIANFTINATMEICEVFSPGSTKLASSCEFPFGKRFDVCF